MKRLLKALICVLAIVMLFSACGTADGGETTVSIPQSNKPLSCTIIVECKNAISSDKLKAEKRDFIPDDGIILHMEDVVFGEGASAYDIIRTLFEGVSCEENCKYCKEGILFESEYTPAYDSYYIKGIHQLYEGDCGEQSGWVSILNGEMMTVSLNGYKMQEGDTITLAYSCDWGADLGFSME